MSPEFALAPDLVYLNHAGIAPWPRRTRAAVVRFARENARYGARNYPHWLATETRLRERLARLLGTPDPDEIALLKNTSEGLSLVAQGLAWWPGDNIVGIVQEFPSNRIPWQALAGLGVQWRALDLDAARDPEAELLALCDARTRLVAVSWVQYGRGLRLDLPRLATLCRARGIPICVDAIQGLGALPFDLAQMPVDCVVADGHKWLLGPEGVAVFYCRPALRDQLVLQQFGWRMVAVPDDYERLEWTPAASARRFECGSPNLLGIHALEASLSLLEEWGSAAIAAAIAERIGYLIERSDAHGFEVLSPRAPERQSGIFTFRVPQVPPAELQRALVEAGVICAARGGGIRFSPHFYTPIEHLERAMDVTAACAHALTH